MSPSVTLSPTQAPFPYGVLAAALFANSLEDGAVSVSFDRDAKALDEDEALAAVGALLKGNEASYPTLSTPLSSSTPFMAVNQIFDQLDNWLAYRTFFGGHSLGIKDFSTWGSIKTNLPALGAIKKNLHVHLGRWYAYMEALPSTIKAVAALAEAKADKGAKKTDISLDLPDAFDGQVVTRFPPEPSGYLHIGHSKAALLNRFFADKYHGKMLLRFDDTNPTKEKAEFEESIIEDLALLNIKADQISHTSDHFDTLHALAIKLIKDGNAYADDTLQMQMRDERMNGIPSSRREEPVAATLERFEQMTLGTDEGQRWCLRAKMSYDDPNKAMRDTVIYRCVKQAHHRTGSKYFSYPTYDFACPVVDSIEGVTHALRTNEYRDRNPQYMWFIDALAIRKPHLWDFSRLNFVYTLLSKRKLHWFVNENHVDGWDDPRFPTVRGIRRRGLTIDALKEFIISQGASQSAMTLEWDGIWTINKRILDPVVPRYCALSEKDLVKVEIVGGPASEEIKKLPRHKKNPELGEKETVYSSSILLEQSDAASFDPKEEVTLMDWGNAILLDKDVDSATGIVRSMRMQLHLEGDFKKTKKKVTWLSSSPSAALLPVTLVDFDYLITKKKLEEDDTVPEYLTPTTRFAEEALADPNVLKSIKAGDALQFERKGYYICDKVDEGGRWEFILIPDGRAASVESKAVAKAAPPPAAATKEAGASKAKKGGEKKKDTAAAAVPALGAPVQGLSPTQVVLSEATTGFEIPVSTVMYPVERVYGSSEVPTTRGGGVDMYTAGNVYSS